MSDPFDDDVSDEEVRLAVRKRIMRDDEFFEAVWAREGPLPPPGKAPPTPQPPVWLDNPHSHKRHLEPEERSAQERAAAKGMPRLFSGRY